MKQASFLSLAQTKKLRCERFLDEMEAIVPWERMLELIEPQYRQKRGPGRPKTEVLLMLKIYLLQQWYHLSDPGAEEAIYDRNSFQKFLGIDLLAQEVPDETTILNFRHTLEEHKVQQQLFAVINGYLEERGLMMKAGTIVDATIIAAPSSTKNQEKQRDAEMSSTCKHGQWHFGMKAHIGVDTERGLVHTVETTTAKVHDKQKLTDLLHGEEKAVFGDKGYYDQGKKKEARASGVYWGVLDKATRNHPLSSTQQRRNNKFSSVRSKVEFSFQVLKCQWNYVKVRYRGLAKNTAQLQMLFGLCNLFRVRKQLLAMA